MNSFMYDLVIKNPVLIIIIGLLMQILVASILILIPLMYYKLSMGLFRLAQSKNISNSWFAFVPILQLYIMGKAAGEVRIASFVIPKLEFVFPIVTLLAYLELLEKDSLSLPFIMLQAQMASMLGVLYMSAIWVGKICFYISIVLTFIVAYKIYKTYRENDTVRIMVISIITLGIAIPFYIYKIGEGSKN